MVLIKASTSGFLKTIVDLSRKAMDLLVQFLKIDRYPDIIQAQGRAISTSLSNNNNNSFTSKKLIYRQEVF
jgi:hypothetical protein